MLHWPQPFGQSGRLTHECLAWKENQSDFVSEILTAKNKEQVVQLVKEWAGDQAPVSSQKAWPAAAFKKKKNNNLLFCTKVELINNVVMVSGEQQRDSAIHTHVSILLQTPPPIQAAT